MRRLPKRKRRNPNMSLAAHHTHELPADARRALPAGIASAPEFTKGKTLLMQSLRMLLAVAVIVTVVIAAAGIKLAIWLPLYLR
jgi:type IV secretory pathway component VirB8